METPLKPVEETPADLTLNETADAAVEATEVTESAEAAEENAEAEETARPQRFNTSTEVIIALTELSQLPAEEIGREDVSRLRQIFNTLLKAEADAALQAYLAEGGDAFAYVPDAEAAKAEEIVGALVAQIKEKRAAHAAQVEAQEEANRVAKQALIDEIAELAKDADDVNRHFTRFREIQNEFKAIGKVSERVASDLWKKYQDAVELFYDQLKVNRELRDYDFKKNLDAKLIICSQAEALADEEDVVKAFNSMRALFEQWRGIGPVAKELRDSLWERFKAAETVVNKAHNAFFEERKQREAANEEAKTRLCERIEAIDLASIDSFNAWNEATETVRGLQEEWKTLGFASKKVNNTLYSRFRAACDKFFEQKAAYYKTVKEGLNDNLAKKTALCEEAESLKDSTAWKQTAQRMAELQKQWREIGAVPKKQSDALWKRFQDACDQFFSRRKEDLNSARHSEAANLRAKRELTRSLAELPADMPREEVIAAIKDAQQKWQQIGHVPFREKETAYAEFRAAIDNLYATRDLRAKRENMARFESSLETDGDTGRLPRERERLLRILEQKQADLATYRNNLGFFNFKSASGSAMLKDIERKTQRLEEDIEEIKNKISLIDSKL